MKQQQAKMSQHKITPHKTIRNISRNQHKRHYILMKSHETTRNR